MKKIVPLSILFIIAVALAAMAIAGRKPADLVVVFPELNSTQRNFIMPLVSGYREETGGQVRYEFKDISEIYGELESGQGAGDLYYMISNFQLNQMKERSLFSQVKIDSVKNIAPVLSSDGLYTPVSWYPWGIFYNRSIFQEFNLSEPETWEEFLTLCEEVKNAGYFPLSLMTKIKWPSSLWFDYIDVLLNGESFHRQLLAGETSFLDTRVRNAFKEIMDLHKEGYVHMDSESFDWVSLVEDMEDETSVMALSGSFFYESASDELKKKLGWFPFPEANTLIASSSGFVMPKNSDNERSAGIFLEYCLSEKGQDLIQGNSDLKAVNAVVLEKLERTDLNQALSRLGSYDSQIPSLERNTHQELNMLLKSSVNILYALEDDFQIDSLLEKLEEQRLGLEN